jgi:hypothetical protein
LWFKIIWNCVILYCSKSWSLFLWSINLYYLLMGLKSFLNVAHSLIKKFPFWKINTMLNIKPTKVQNKFWILFIDTHYMYQIKNSPTTYIITEYQDTSSICLIFLLFFWWLINVWDSTKLTSYSNVVECRNIEKYSPKETSA